MLFCHRKSSTSEFREVNTSPVMICCQSMWLQLLKELASTTQANQELLYDVKSFSAHPKAFCDFSRSVILSPEISKSEFREPNTSPVMIWCQSMWRQLLKEVVSMIQLKQKRFNNENKVIEKSYFYQRNQKALSVISWHRKSWKSEFPEAARRSVMIS